MATKTLYIVRHGETQFNVMGRCQGWSDSPLTERGIEQCRRAGQAIAARGVRFDHAYCSSSERCCDTLEALTEAAFGQAMPYVREKDLREANFGSWEGGHHYREAFELVQVPSFAPAPEGESGDEACARFERRLDQIMAQPDHQCVLVTTSGGVSLQFYYAHRDSAEVEQHIFCNCLCYVYAWEDGLWRCQEIFAPDIEDLARPGEGPQIRRI